MIQSSLAKKTSDPCVEKFQREQRDYVFSPPSWTFLCEDDEGGPLICAHSELISESDNRIQCNPMSPPPRRSTHGFPSHINSSKNPFLVSLPGQRYFNSSLLSNLTLQSLPSSSLSSSGSEIEVTSSPLTIDGDDSADAGGS